MSDLSEQSPAQRVAFSREMRERFLTRPASEWKIEPSAENPAVYGVLMEWEAEGVTFTITSFCEGTASVYDTLGSVMIGGHTNEVINAAARALVKAAGEFHAKASPAHEFPDPGPERVQFYLLTFEGVRVLRDALEPVTDGRSRYAPLFQHGWSIFTGYSNVSDPDVDGAEGSGHRKEWSGPEGYANCLLTAMQRGIGRSFVITAGTPVPNLVSLAVGNDDLRDWLAAQEFPYETLPSRDVIRAFRQYARVLPLPFLTRRAECPAVHATNEGRLVACIFDVEFAPFDRSMRVVMASSHDRRVAALQRQTDARAAA